MNKKLKYTQNRNILVIIKKGWNKDGWIRNNES
mgnify:CR=1 FL=1